LLIQLHLLTQKGHRGHIDGVISNLLCIGHPQERSLRFKTAGLRIQRDIFRAEIILKREVPWLGSDLRLVVHSIREVVGTQGWGPLIPSCALLWLRNLSRSIHLIIISIAQILVAVSRAQIRGGILIHSRSTDTLSAGLIPLSPRVKINFSPEDLWTLGAWHQLCRIKDFSHALKVGILLITNIYVLRCHLPSAIKWTFFILSIIIVRHDYVISELISRRVMLVGYHVWLLFHLLLALECRLWWGSTSRSSRCAPSVLLGYAVWVRWNTLVSCVFDSRVLIQGEFRGNRNVFRVIELYFRLRNVCLLLLLLPL
jgi:hypothetical protein